jgi:hypothetical protein
MRREILNQQMQIAISQSEWRLLRKGQARRWHATEMPLTPPKGPILGKVLNIQNPPLSPSLSRFHALPVHALFPPSSKTTSPPIDLRQFLIARSFPSFVLYSQSPQQHGGTHTLDPSPLPSLSSA